MRKLFLLCAFVLSSFVPAAVHGATFPGNEEIQTIAYSASPTGLPEIAGVGAGLAVPDVSLPANADVYYAGAVGLTNFQGHTYQGGAMKFCTAAVAGGCAVRPFGSIQRTGFFQRNIDVTKTLGNVVYTYNVFRPDSARPTYWAVRWSGGNDSLVVISSDSGNNLSGLQNAFTSGVSLGTWWGVIKVQGWGYMVGATTYSPCYAGTDSRNTLNASVKGMPRTMPCKAGGAGVVIWQHEFASRVNIPIVQR